MLKARDNIKLNALANPPERSALQHCYAYMSQGEAVQTGYIVFSAGKISYATPASGDVLYSIGASAFTPLSGGAGDCVPPTKTASLDTNGNPLIASLGTTVTPKEIDFTGCT